MMRVTLLLSAFVLMLAVPLPLRAQQADAQTLADIRQELTVLYAEIQKLKRELSTTGAPALPPGDGSVLDRVSAIEQEVQRLTARTEELDYRIQRIVEDGTNRIGDLEFRLVELEGGDVRKLGETTTLGGPLPDAESGGAASVPADVPAVGDDELAVGEKADFEAARKALDEGRYQEAATLFANFSEDYPGSPLEVRADLGRGRALDGLGDTREAARAYLAAFSAAPKGPMAPVALRELGAALGRLGQIEQACVTLGEVGVRFPQSPAVADAEKDMAALGCN